MAVYQCDWCNDEVATTSLSDMTSGDVKFIGPNCLPLFASAIIASLPELMLDPVLKAIGYQPTKALRDERKAAELPEIDPNRTIGEVVEDQPRPPGSDDLGAVAPDMEETVIPPRSSWGRVDNPEDSAPY